ncbi:unnamed protein product [Mytilus coruscus]|uniref:Integrase zinc-binding domain-containing protein n=1 Tax=Mytilus coruscus TaxID=42192 RepID=A0A6J7ZVS5_MYTCO|nr:unnamed protein product [Mytilus coruscus]
MIADTIGLHQIINIDQFSSYQKLLRRIGNSEYFYNGDSKPQHRKLCRNNEGLKGETNENSLVKQLKLYLDDENIIRWDGGRINNANTLESAKFPVLLPSKEKLTDLNIIDAHTRNCHCGLESTVTVLSQHFWIPTIRRYVKTLLRCCVTCRKVTGRPYPVPDPPPLTSRQTS